MEGSGRSLSAPVGSLGSRRPCGRVWFPDRTPLKSRDFTGLPIDGLTEHRCPADLCGLLPKKPNRRMAEESGFGLRLALLPQRTRSSALWRAARGRLSASAMAAAGTAVPFPEGGLPAANSLHDSVFRVAASGIFAIRPVEREDNVDKMDLCRFEP